MQTYLIFLARHIATRLTYAAMALLLLSSLGIAGDFGNQFVTAKLAYGVSVSIPRSWQIMRGNEMRTIETAVGAAIDLTKYSKLVEGTESLLASTFPDPDLYAAVAITSGAMPTVTSAFPASLTAKQVKEGEPMIRQPLEAILGRMGIKVWGWTALEKVTMGGKTVMHISYLRSSDEGDRRVHMYKFFGAGRIYDLALSTTVKSERINTVVLDKIANSFVGP